MRALFLSLLAFSTVLAGSPGVVAGQSLGDLARKEEARRNSVKAGEKAKVITNKDLGDVPPAPATPAAAVPSAAADASKPAAPAGDAAAAPDPEKDREPKKDQAYWAGRMNELRGKLSRDQVYADALQTRINALTSDFVNRDDPAQRGVVASDKQRAMDELARLKQQIDDEKKAIADLEEEARRAGVPPGWLR